MTKQPKTVGAALSAGHRREQEDVRRPDAGLLKPAYWPPDAEREQDIDWFIQAFTETIATVHPVSHVLAEPSGRGHHRCSIVAVCTGPDATLVFVGPGSRRPCLLVFTLLPPGLHLNSSVPSTSSSWTVRPLPSPGPRSWARTATAPEATRFDARRDFLSDHDT